MSVPAVLIAAWSQVPDTVDPAREAIESYIDATGGEAGGAGFPWVLVIGLVVVVAATAALTIVFRRRLR